MAQLIDVQDGIIIWSDSYDRELTQILTIQSEVAMEIARILEVKLSSAESNNITKVSTEDITAYDYVLKAREIRSRASDESDYNNSLALLHQAIGLDDQYADAYAEIADILYFNMSLYGVHMIVI